MVHLAAFMAWVRPSPGETSRSVRLGLLIAPGANGMLGVVACLYWWGKSVLQKVENGIVLDEGSVEDWEEAVADVQWVIEALIRNH